MRRGWRGGALLFAVATAWLAPVALAYVPRADRIAQAVAEHNRAAGRSQRLVLEVALLGQEGEVEARGELVSDPRGFARLELRHRDGSRERFLIRGGRMGASRDGERLRKPRPLLPPLYLLQSDSEPALRAALLALGADPDRAELGHTDRADCYVIGGRAAPGRARRDDPVALWVDQETFEAVAIHRGDGVRYRLGPIVDHGGLRLPAWVEIEADDDDEPLRLEIRGAVPADASPGAFDPGWLRAP